MPAPIMNIADAKYVDLAERSRSKGSTELKMLAVSNMLHPEVCHYPDSGKFGVLDGRGPIGLRHIGRPQDNVDFWQGE